MDLADFNKNHLIKILTLFLINCPQKTSMFFLIRDFNNNLLNYNDYQLTNGFLDSFASNSFIPYILKETRLTSHSKTIINKFSNIISCKVTSGNITATISDLCQNIYLFLLYFQTHPVKRQIFMKEIGLNLFNKTLYLTIMIKIGLTFSNLTKKM